MDGHDHLNTIIVESGIVETVVSSLGSQETCSAAATFLARLVEHSPEAIDAVKATGGIDALVQVLSKGPNEASADAAMALAYLVMNNEASQSALVERNGVALLVSLLGTGITRNVTAAVTALACLAHQNPVSREAVIEGDAVAAILDAVRSNVDMDKVLPMEMLGDLLDSCASAQAKALEAGAIQLLMDVVSSGSDDERATSVAVIGRLVQSNPAGQYAMIDAQAIAPLVRYVGHELMSVHQNTLFALGCLVDRNDAAQEACVRADIMPAVIQALRSEHDSSVDSAFFLLRVLVRHSAIAQESAVANGAVSCILHHLQARPEVSADFALSVLLHLGRSDPSEFIDCDGVSLLLKRLRTSDAQANAVALLDELVIHHPIIRKLVVEAGGVITLVELFESDDEVIVGGAGQALAYLVMDDSAAADQATRLGAIAILGTKLRNLGVLYALTNLADGQLEVQNELVELGVLPRLFEQLFSEREAIQANTLDLLNAIVTSNGEAQLAFLACGGMSVLLKLLERASPNQMDSVAYLLASVLEDNAEDHAREVVAVGAVRLLADSIKAEMSDGMVKVAEALHHLALVETSAVDELVGNKVVERVVGYLSEGAYDENPNGLRLLSWLIKSNQTLCASANDAGALQMIRQAIKADSDEVKVLAMVVLEDLVKSCDSVLASDLARGIVQDLLVVLRGSVGDLIILTCLPLDEILSRADAGALSPEVILDVVNTVLDVISRLGDDEALYACTTGSMIDALVDSNPPAQAHIFQAGVIGRFIELIRDGAITVKLGCALALSSLAKNHSDIQKQLGVDGVVPFLIELVQDYQGIEKATVVDALGDMIEANSELQILAVESGAVEILVQLLCDDDDELVSCAAWTLSRLIHENAAAVTAVLDVGVLELAMEQFRSTTEEQKVYMAELLLYLDRACSDPRLLTLEEEILQFLTEALQVTDDDSTKSDILKGLGDFVENAQCKQDAVVQAGLVEPLLISMSSTRRDTRAKSIVALRHLIRANDAAGDSAVAAGAIERLVETLCTGCDTIQPREVAHTLHILAHGRPSVRALISKRNLEPVLEGLIEDDRNDETTGAIRQLLIQLK